MHCSTNHVAGCPVSRSVNFCWTFPHSSTVPCTHSVPIVPYSAHFFNYVCCSCFLRFLLIQIKCATITFYLSKWLTLQTPPETKVLDSQKAPETDLFLIIFLSYFFLLFFTHCTIGDVQTGLELLLCKVMLQSQCGTNFSLKSQIAGNCSETCGREGRDKEALENKYAS